MNRGMRRRIGGAHVAACCAARLDEDYTSTHHTKRSDQGMLVKPNTTELEAIVKKVTRSPDGIGAMVQIDVLANHHPDATEDFVGAKAGQTIEVFSSTPESLTRGERYLFETSLVGGPRKQQIVARAAKKITP
jgi:hypothetical protein